MLVDHSGGQFIYPTTVIKFIRTEDSNPCIQLQTILDLIRRNISSYHISPTKPYFDLDILYQQILKSATKDYEKLLSVLAFVILLREIQGANPSTIECLLGLHPGEVSLTLRKMHSVLYIQGINDEIIVYHASFIDFLYDQLRSGPFFIDVGFHHHQLVSCWAKLLDESSFYKFKTG
ncbi:hypothetical protein L218DRAFT_871332 [Marasmius fiardii PR-910]|nr:hypothetical protein L218DRAFT_871332 [Marasmius fiardii PR-910]